MKNKESTFILKILFFGIFFNVLIANAADTLMYKKELIKNKLSTIESVYTAKQAKQFIHYFTSIYPKNKAKMYDFLSHDRWEKILQFQYKNATENNAIDITTQFAYFLAIIYHRQTKYENAIPFLNEALRNKLFLSREQLKDVLLRQEICFRSMGQFKKSLEIRKERVRNHFINNLWELYSLVGLTDEAIKEFKLFEKEPAKNDFEKINYYNKLGTLFLDSKQTDSALFYFKKMEKQAVFIILNDNYEGKTNYSEYVKNYLQALAISQQGECYLLLEQYKKAIPLLKAVIPLCKEIKEIDQQIIKWTSLSNAYNEIGNPRMAIKYLDSVSSKIIKKKMLKTELLFLKQRALSSQILGKYLDYNTYMTNYFQLKDSIYNENQINQGLLFLVKYDLNQKKTLLKNEQNKIYTLELETKNKKKIIVIYILMIMILLIVINFIFHIYKKELRRRSQLKLSNKKLKIFAKKIEQQSKKMNS